ncbi:MAG: hypothetical protein FWC68_04955, partial [Oscillospiraceae bacterium]|nr:hypothetical protein [Oscillospiraceae bacterium]
GIDTVISNLYRYHTAQVGIIIQDSNGEQIARFDSDAEPDNPPWRIPGGYRQRVDLFLGGRRGSINNHRQHDQNNPHDPNHNVIFGGGREDSGRRVPRIPTPTNPDAFINSFRSLELTENRFTEEFIEIMIRGEVEVAEDGSEIITRPPVRKIFLIYTVVPTI